MSIFMFSQPVIDSYKEDNGTAVLTVSCKSNECGFIAISKQHVTFQFFCGWNNFGKGHSNLDDVDLIFEKERLTMIHKTTKRKIFKLKCERELFDKIVAFSGKQ